MKVMVVSPHMDDETLGMGGTIAKHVSCGDEVSVVIVAHRVYDHKFDASINEKELQATKQAKEVLGYQHLTFLNLHDERLDNCIQDILIPLEKVYVKFNPDFLYTCHYGDNNQDHRAVFEAVRILGRASSSVSVSKFLCYEVLSSTEASPPAIQNAFMPNYFVNIDDFIEKKISAFKCYEKEQRSFPHPRSYEGVKILAQKRGMDVGFNFAEAFVILRDEWR